MTPCHYISTIDIAGKNRNRNSEVEREFHVKWQLKGGGDLVIKKKQLLQLLAIVLVEFPSQVTLVDRKQREWTFQESDDEEKFHKEFEKAAVQLHPVKTRQQKVNHWVSIVTFRSITNIKDWKDNDRVYSHLDEGETYLFPHPFGKDAWDIMSIGFLKEIHVVHHPKEDLHKHICKLIQGNKTNINIPPFQLIPQRITTKDKAASTKAFTIQCLKSDAKELTQDLTQGAFRDPLNQMFVPFKYKQTKPDVFLQCIRQQNEVYYKTWVIKLEGLTEKAMEMIKPKIMSQSGVYGIVSTKRTGNIGEWKVLVDQSKCAYVHRTLSTIWQQLVKSIPRETREAALDTYPSPRISSKKHESIKTWKQMTTPMAHYSLPGPKLAKRHLKTHP